MTRQEERGEERKDKKMSKPGEERGGLVLKVLHDKNKVRLQELTSERSFQKTYCRPVNLQAVGFPESLFL